MNYREVSLEAITMAGECVHYETASEARRSIQSFWQDFKARGKIEALEAYRDDQIDGFIGVLIPKPNDRLDYMIAVSSDQEPVEFEIRKLPAGKYLIFEAEGPLPYKLREVMDAIHHDFLPKSSYRLREAPVLEHYPAGDTQSADYIAEIWIPVV